MPQLPQADLCIIVGLRSAFDAGFGYAIRSRAAGLQVAQRLQFDGSRRRCRLHALSELDGPTGICGYLLVASRHHEWMRR